MSNDIKNTLTTLLNDELIIPEIQRDYVWGNNEIVLKRFLKNIFNNKDNELDIGFFYAYKVYQDTKKEENKGICDLIDGQQRITTLVLLYWYLGIGKDYIKKFKFKVRENCNNFLEKLLEKDLSNVNEGRSISEKIKNCIWYLSIWDNDPTVKSMLKALDIIENEFNKITENKENIKSNIEQNIIFTCITNNDRGLEKEYISLNARGRELEQYEKLKAILVEDMDNKKVEYMKDRNEWLEKWEKDWQDILWECKGDNVYNTDNIWNAILYWARDIFVIENNIYKEKDNNKSKKEEIDFDLISIKGKNDKLLEIFDWIIPALKIINKNKDSFQKKCQFDEKNKVININTIIAGDKKESYKLEFKEKALFYGLLYLVKSKYNIESVESIKNKELIIDENDEILEKTRIFRNLIQNSDINSNNLKNAVESLKLLAEKTIDNNFNELLNNKEIKGIDHEQKYEEALKLEILTQYPKHKDTILNIENNVLFKGRIKNIFLLAYSENNKKFIYNYNLHTKFFKEIFFDEEDSKLKLKDETKLNLFDKLLEQYRKIYDIKNQIWGELLLYDDIYYNSWNHRIKLINNDETLGLLFLIFLYHNSELSIDDFKLPNREKAIKLIKENLKSIDCKLQLYILYLLGKCNFYNKNFGVLYKEKDPDLEEKYYNNSPFDTKFVFQPYKYRWVGGQKPIFFDEKVDLEKDLEQYLK